MTVMTLRECEELAKKSGYDRASFDLCGPTGRLKATWLDAYFGLFVIEGQSGFNTVKQAEEYGLWAENFSDAPASQPSLDEVTGAGKGEEA